MKSGEPDSDDLAYLHKKQGEINKQNSYEGRVAKGKKLWKNKSARRFENVRAKLVELCVGKRRCNYCEDSAANDVEHIKPKDLYPEFVFIWENYLFACDICNRSKKNNKFAIFDYTGKFRDVTRKQEDPITRPPAGSDAIIDPRYEDPLDFIFLDLSTFSFIPKSGISSRKGKRAEYTIHLLDLNRDYLLASRREACHSYYDSLKTYVNDKQNGASSVKLAQKASELKSRQHPTVWVEMKRQSSQYPALEKLFASAPELL